MNLTQPYGGLPYSGGKQQMAEWIAERLPKSDLYIEPFAGMLSVLFARDRSQLEIVNDLNDRIVNWWQVCKDQPEELMHELVHTPHSETVFHRACDTQDEGTPLERAVKFSIVVTQSLSRTDTGTSFAFVLSPSGRWGRLNRPQHLCLMRLQATAERIQHLQITCRPALDLLATTVPKAEAVIYCDPPYHSAHTKQYRAELDDIDALVEVLLQQTGKVAISGYGTEWDRLGWERHEREARVSQMGKGHVARTEVLWTNFTPVQYTTKQLAL